MPTRPVLRPARVRRLAAGALGVLGAALLASAAPAQLAFTSAPILPTFAPSAIADVDGDGYLDVVTKEFGGPAVYLGLPDGTFADAIGSSGPLVGSGFVLGDVNGDGRADLVAPHAFSGSDSALDVRLATPSATFLDAQVVSLPHVPGTLLLHDVSGDGVLDIVALTKAPSIRFMLLLGHGDGSFDTPQELPSLGAGFLAFGDLNGDRLTDIVLSRIEGGGPFSGLTALLGQGSGSFGSPLTLHRGSVWGFELGDVLGAGRDSIVMGGIAGALRLFTLQPHEGLSETLVPVPGLVLGQSPHVHQVVAGGPLEIVTFSEFGEGLDTVLIHEGGGRFSAAPEYWAPGIEFVTVADANHDGAADIVTSGGIVRGQGDGSFEPWYGLPAPATDLAAADVTGDGRTDIVTAFGDTTALLHQGRLDGTLAPPQPLDLGLAPAQVRLLDVAGSPIVDALTLAIAEPGGESLLGVSVGHGDGTFAPPVLTPVGPANAMAVADLDADGRPDVLPWPGTVVLLNAGGGGWTAMPVPSSLDVLQVAAGDFDGDGHQDLVRLLRQPANILKRETLLGHGDGTFTALPTVQIGITGSVGSLTGVHLDADGQLDLAFTWNGFLAVFAGHGDGSFGAAQFLEHAGTPLFVDLTGDGHVDLLTAGLVAVEGSATGLTDAVTTSPGPSMHDIVLADFDGDEVIDVAGIGTWGLMILPSASGRWHDLQHSLAWSQGYSKLQGVGSLKPDSAVHLLVEHVPPATSLYLVLGLQVANMPLHGGVLVPSPDLVIGGLIADGEGAAHRLARWPAGVPPQTDVFLQAWFVDGPSWGATNAVVGTTPP